MHVPGRGEGALRRGRASIPNTSYFLTLCTEARRQGLNRNEIAQPIRNQIAAMETEGHWSLRGAVVMPDHLHLLVRISEKTALSRCVARLKTKTRASLSAGGLSWQPNFYEHRLRPKDTVEEVLRYLFLNPYRGEVISPDMVYPWFWLGADEATWFMPGTNDSLPFPEWLR